MNDQEITGLKAGGGLKVPEPNYEIVFSNESEWVVKIHTDTGLVELAEGVELDDASELFWTALAGESPEMLLREIDELKQRLSNYETEGNRVDEFDLAMVSVVEDPEEDCRFNFNQEDVEYFQQKMSEAIGRDDYNRAMKVIK